MLNRFGSWILIATTATLGGGLGWAQIDISRQTRGNLPVGRVGGLKGVVPQKFLGTSAPGSVAGNLPGDLYTDTTAHHVYICNAPDGTAAPACTAVATAGWKQIDGGAAGAGGSAQQVQFNSGGTLTGDAGLVYNEDVNSLGTGSVTVGQAGVQTGQVVFNGVTSGNITVKPADVAGTATLTLPSTTGALVNVFSMGRYEVGAENAAAALATADLTSYGFVVNGALVVTLTEASCISDAGDQAVTVKIGETTLFSIHCVAPASYSVGTTDGTTGYLVGASMSSASVAAHAMLDLSGTANTTTKDVKLHMYGKN